MGRLSSPAGCGGCSVRGKPGRCLQDSVSTNRGTRVRHQPRPRPTARSRFSSSSGSVSPGSKSRARRPDAPAWEATAAHLRADAHRASSGAFLRCEAPRPSVRVETASRRFKFTRQTFSAKSSRVVYMRVNGLSLDADTFRRSSLYKFQSLLEDTCGDKHS
jgi:hypothetical protein